MVHERVAQRPGVPAQLVDPLGLLAEDLESRHGGGRGGWGKGGREDQRARPVDEELGELLLAADVGPVGAERLAEGADHQIHLALEPGRGHRAAPAGAEAARRVRLVDHHARVVALSELDDVRERRDVTVH